MNETKELELLAELSKPLPIEGRQQTDGRKTRKMYDTDGYGYQYVINRFNVLLGSQWGFNWEILYENPGKTSTGKTKIEFLVKVGIWVKDRKNVRECVGGHTSESYTDALKGAITSGFKKTAAFWGVGRHAYEGSINNAYVDDDNKPYPEGWDEAAAETKTIDNNQQQKLSENNDKKTSLSPQILFAQLNELNLGKQYPDLYKLYCYEKYNVSSMKELNPEQLRDQNKILGTLRNDPEWTSKFREKLNSFVKSKEDQYKYNEDNLWK